MTTRRHILDRIAAALVPLYAPREARNIAQLYVCEAARISLSALLSDPGAPLEIEGLDEAIAELAGGRPVQYVVGSTEFFGRRFAVREGVLIPRPETEELAAWIVADEGQARRLLDIGTGSGCIAATLALELPRAEIFAADISEAAIAVAAENCRTLGANVVFRRANALADLSVRFPERFDVLVSNPPYVPAGDRASMHPNVRDYEPSEALFVPDDDPLLFYRAIAQAGRRMLVPGGRLYFEIYHTAAAALERLLAENGYGAIRLREDINGKPRMLCARMD